MQMLNLNRTLGIGTRLRITVAEPWEVVSALPSPTIAGRVLLTDHLAAVLIQLDEPVSYSGEDYKHLLASPRHLGDSFTTGIGSLYCAIVSVNDKEAEEGSLTAPADLNGRLKLIGDVEW